MTSPITPLTLAEYRRDRDWRRTCTCSPTANLREDATLQCVVCDHCGAPLVRRSEPPGIPTPAGMWP